MAETRRILLVEDDPRVAAMIADMLEEADYAVDGPYGTLADGMAALAKHFPAGAVLDLTLQDSDAGGISTESTFEGRHIGRVEVSKKKK